MVISISNAGYVKRLPVSTYRAQGRGGKGLRGVRLKDDDYIQHLFIASTHHYLLFFTNFGKVYRQKVHELPQGARDSRGRHIANVLALREGEEVRAVFATRDYSEGKYLVLATRDGMVKKTEMRAYDTVLRELGLIAIQLTDGDELVGVQLTDGDEDLLFVSARGQAARFHESAARPMGRDTRGVRAMNLDPGDRVLAMCVARDDEDLLVVTGNGYGKRTPMGDYPTKGRPTKGVRTIKVSDRKGELVTARPVREGDELLLISLGGQVIRIKADSVRRTGRSTEGVRIMNMSDDDLVCGVASVVEGTEDENGLDDERRDDGASRPRTAPTEPTERAPRSERPGGGPSRARGARRRSVAPLDHGLQLLHLPGGGVAHRAHDPADRDQRPRAVADAVVDADAVARFQRVQVHVADGLAILLVDPVGAAAARPARRGCARAAAPPARRRGRRSVGAAAQQDRPRDGLHQASRLLAGARPGGHAPQRPRSVKVTATPNGAPPPVSTGSVLTEIQRRAPVRAREAELPLADRLARRRG